MIVVDPPRKGCDEHCLETIIKMAPPKVVYVSCDPATLARDVKYLGEHGYELKQVRCCDMFGHFGAYRDLCVATKTNYVEILNFRHFFKHIALLRARAIKSEIER